jgi:DASH complex subunit ASK1
MPEAPELHAEIFSSPVRKSRMPGVSVLTPAKPAAAGGTVSRPADPGAAAGIWDSDDDDLNEDDDSGFPFGQSPPKTMQFHVPQSRLLKTPGTSIVLLLQWLFWGQRLLTRLYSAREASKRIVEDLLRSAGVGRGGGGDDEDTTDDFAMGGTRMMVDETSPSVVRKAEAFEDESF